MNTTLLVQYGIPAALSVISAVVGHWWGSRGKPIPGAAKVMPAVKAIPGVAANLWSEPVVQLFFSKLVDTAQANNHAMLNAAVAKFLPPAVPFLPVIDKAVETAEAKAIRPVQSENPVSRPT